MTENLISNLIPSLSNVTLEMKTEFFTKRFFGFYYFFPAAENLKWTIKILEINISY